MLADFFYDIATVCGRDFLVLKRRLVKFILSRMVAPILYLVAFGWGLGRNIDASGGYMDFLVPGLLALNSMNISFNGAVPVHAERIYHKSLEEYIMSPMNPTAFVIGKIFGGAARGLISSAVLLLLAFIFGANVNLTLFAALALFVNCLLFSALGFFAAMKIDTYEEMGQVNTYILLPMSFLCGTFFSVNALPAGISAVISLLPLTQTSVILRASMTSGEIMFLPCVILLIYLIFCFYIAKKSFLDLVE